MFVFCLWVEVKTAIAILAAEIDRTTPPELAQQFADILTSKSEVINRKIYP